MQDASVYSNRKCPLPEVSNLFCLIQLVHSFFLSFHACATEDKTFTTFTSQKFISLKQEYKYGSSTLYPCPCITQEKYVSTHSMTQTTQKLYIIHLKVKYFLTLLKESNHQFKSSQSLTACYLVHCFGSSSPLRIQAVQKSLLVLENHSPQKSL